MNIPSKLHPVLIVHIEYQLTTSNV